MRSARQTEMPLKKTLYPSLDNRRVLLYNIKVSFPVLSGEFITHIKTEIKTDAKIVFDYREKALG